MYNASSHFVKAPIRRKSAYKLHSLVLMLVLIVIASYIVVTFSDKYSIMQNGYHQSISLILQKDGKINDDETKTLILSIDSIISLLRNRNDQQSIFGPIHWKKLSKISNFTNEFNREYIDCDIYGMNIVKIRGFCDYRQGDLENIPIGLRSYVNTNVSPAEWDIEGIKYWRNKASNKHLDCGPEVYPNSARQHYDVLDKYRHILLNKNVLVAGSMSPWLESILLSYNINVTSVDYNPPKLVNDLMQSDDRNIINIITMEQLNEMKYKYQFDAVFSFSSIEHDGLGRYGDPINPKGDIAAMFEFYSFLKYNTDSYLFLGIPIAEKDHLIYNCHRLYGPCRFNRLINLGLFDVVDVFGTYDNEMHMTKQDALDNQKIFIGSWQDAWAHQPIFAMRKNIINQTKIVHIRQILNL
eukprot:44118_1